MRATLPSLFLSSGDVFRFPGVTIWRNNGTIHRGLGSLAWPHHPAEHGLLFRQRQNSNGSGGGCGGDSMVTSLKLFKARKNTSYSVFRVVRV
jgi:hypothetical protein